MRSTTRSSGAAAVSRAPYACGPDDAGGRAHPEPEDDVRSAFQRDRDRIVHCTAFRRLEYKTQVFANFEGDHFRTRLTHSLEVAQIARTLARALRLDEDLTEAIALAHDLGHPPFGHAGEAALAVVLRDHGGFDHNLQTFRILTRLERRYIAFQGLNLCAATLEGVLKHNGPLRDPPAVVAALAERLPLRLHDQGSLEGQIAAVADDLAYTAHDIDDGARAGLFDPSELEPLPLVGPIVRELRAAHPQLDRTLLLAETTRRLIDLLVRDVLATTRRELAEHGIVTLADVRALPQPAVRFEERTSGGLRAVRAFLHDRVYRHYKVSRMTRKARRLVTELFAALLEAPECLPAGWRESAGVSGSRDTAETVRDYIAGMTDRFALDEHDRLFRLGRERA